MNYLLIKNNIEITIIYDEKKQNNDKIFVKNEIYIKNEDPTKKDNFINEIIDTFILRNPVANEKLDNNESLHFIFITNKDNDDEEIKKFFNELNEKLNDKLLKIIKRKNPNLNIKKVSKRIAEAFNTNYNVININNLINENSAGGYKASNRKRHLYSKQAVKSNKNPKYYKISRKKQNKPQKHHIKTPKLRKKNNTSPNKPLSNKPPSKKRRTYKQSSQIKKKKKSQTIKNYTKQTKN